MVSFEVLGERLSFRGIMCTGEKSVDNTASGA